MNIDDIVYLDTEKIFVTGNVKVNGVGVENDVGAEVSIGGGKGVGLEVGDKVDFGYVVSNYKGFKGKVGWG